jgi:hypothetical protein
MVTLIYTLHTGITDLASRLFGLSTSNIFPVYLAYQLAIFFL